MSKPVRLNNSQIRTISRKLTKLSELSSMPAKEWKRRLDGVPIDVITKTMGFTTQLTMHVERESRSMTRKHITSRSPMLKNLSKK